MAACHSHFRRVRDLKVVTVEELSSQVGERSARLIQASGAPSVSDSSPIVRATISFKSALTPSSGERADLDNRRKTVLRRVELL